MQSFTYSYSKLCFSNSNFSQIIKKSKKKRREEKNEGEKRRVCTNNQRLNLFFKIMRVEEKILNKNTLKNSKKNERGEVTLFCLFEWELEQRTKYVFHE
jgi:hypothetical protein